MVARVQPLSGNTAMSHGTWATWRELFNFYPSHSYTSVVSLAADTASLVVGLRIIFM